MTPARWQQMRAMFEMARAVPNSDRRAVLERAGGPDPSLVGEVLALLAQGDQAASFLEPIEAPTCARPEGPAMPGATIAGCQIVRLVGHGGMGAVFEAWQRVPRRRVALKLLHAGAAGDAASVRLFQREVDALALLNHPAIATIHEAGSTEDGQAYIIMEFVEGRSLAEFVAARPLGDEERLRLFLKVARAVAHAHGRGVIHRDIKPSNIVVDETGEPRVLDFGLARIIDGASVASASTTCAGRIQGTLAYISPEQLRASPPVLDVRADVYALGVVLYELLTGRLPFDISRLLLPQAARLICESSPIPPRTRRPNLDEDLETILLRVLARDPDRRYQSVTELIADLENFMAHRPIQARRDHAWYTLRKAARRHRVGLALIGSFAGLVLGFGVVVTVQSARLAAERNVAVRALRTAELEQRRANSNLQRALTALDVTLVRISERHPGEPAELGQLRRNLLDDSLALYHDLIEDGPNSAMRLETARAYAHLAKISRELGLKEEADTAYGQAVASYSHLHREEPGNVTYSAELARTWNGWGTLLCDAGEWERAEQAFRQALEGRQRLVEARPPFPEYQFELSRSCNSLGRFLRHSGRVAEAEAMLQRAVGLLERLHEARPRNVEYLDNLILAELRLGEVLMMTPCAEHAEAHYLAALRLVEPLAAASPGSTKYSHRYARAMSSYGHLLISTGRYQQAEVYLARALELASAVAAGHPAFPRYHEHVEEIVESLALIEVARASTAVAWAPLETGR